MSSTTAIVAITSVATLSAGAITAYASYGQSGILVPVGARIPALHPAEQAIGQEELHGITDTASEVL